MDISEIKMLPSTLGTGPNSPRYHESLFRSYHILEKVKALLALEVPPSVVSEIIEDIEKAPTNCKEL